MESLLLYFVKVNIALALFYLLYVMFFRKDTFIRIRRYYFLSAIIFSLAYPIMNVTVLGNLINITPETVATETSVYIGEISMGEMIVDHATEEATPIDWMLIGKNILLIGASLLSLRFLWQLFSIIRIKSRSEKKSLFGYLFHQLKDEITPFSFFNWIFIHTDTHTEKELKQILLHEHTHVSQWHSLDILLVELLRIVFWWNPVVWLMKRDIAINLEYLADQAVLQKGVESIEYQYHLLQMTNHETAVQIVNNFNVSQLKQRIIMMNTNKTPMRKLIKYLSILPLALLLIAANSIYAQQNETQQEPVKIENKDSEYKSRFHEVIENSDKLAATLKAEVKYPQDAKENGIEGDVGASFIIEVDGSVTNPKIELGLLPPLNKEVIRVINAMPKLKQFTYTKDDEPLRIKYHVHFSFRLDGSKTSYNVKIGGMNILTIADKTGDDKPLFIVDGVKMDKEFDMSKIDRSDIEHRTIYQKEAAMATYGEEGKYGAVIITTKKENTPSQEQELVKKESKSNEVFMVVEKQPSFKGNVKAMMEFIETEMKYPLIAKENGIQGRVIVNYIVEKDGSLSDVQIVRGVDPSLDKEAIRIIEAMPKWNPGLQRDERVRVRYTLPITFKLDENKDSSEMATASVKILKDKEGEEVIARGYGSMKDEKPKELSLRFGTGEDPLVIIDDVKMPKGSDLNDLNPDDIKSISVLKAESAMSIYGEEGKDGVILITLKDKTKIATTKTEKIGPKIKSNRDDVFVVVEDQPEFPGGMQALMKYLGENIRYPEEAHKNSIEGRVISNFVVNKDGSISDIEIIRGVDPLLDAEAIRVLSMMPLWKPGMQRGEKVNVRFTIPVVFRLNKDEAVDEEAMNKLKEKGGVTVYDERIDDPDKGFLKFIAQTIKYPLIAQENGIMGVTRATYDVNANGEISNVKITESVDPSLDAELIRVTKLMPKDIALMKSGGKAASDVEISALFRLQGDGTVPPPPPVKSDVVVVGYAKPAE